VPEINVTRVPVLKIRFGGAGGSKDEMKRALRYGANWVGGENPLALVPWDAEPEKTENEKNREKTRELIKYAHSLHMKYFTAGDEFSYHPSLLKEFGAVLSPCEPAFWDALQAKYRRLLQVIPELDGIRIRTGEVTRFWGNYKTFDVMHDGKGCDWSLEKRYRTFVKKVYDVVVGEFDKIYFHRTWVANSYEQHSQPDVFRKIFTEDIPIKNLYLSPYLSKTDRWFYQPYNPTFNLTAHNMIVLLAHLDYHAGSEVKVFPTFPGQYFQGGLQMITAAKPNNLKGANFNIPSQDSWWDTVNLTTYTAFRLSWEPFEDLREIAEDFASIYFGRSAADKMADIYLLSPAAYKHGIYIKPVAEVTLWNPLQHLRLTIFPVQGYPSIDKQFTGDKNSTAYQQCMLNRDYLKNNIDQYNVLIFAGRWSDIVQQHQEQSFENLLKLANQSHKKVIVMSEPYAFDANISLLYKRSLWLHRNFNLNNYFDNVKAKQQRIALQHITDMTQRYPNTLLLTQADLFKPNHMAKESIPYSLDGRHLSVFGSLSSEEYFTQQAKYKVLKQFLSSSDEP